MPQFSIVIPTKDRPSVLSGTIKYCLSQTFNDFEAVIVDNGSDDAAKELFDGFDDARLRYVRTGNLSMPDNWDRALSAAQGDYIYIIGDKIPLHQDALAIVHESIKADKADLLSFPYNSGYVSSTTADIANSCKKIPSSAPLEAIKAGRLKEFMQWFGSYTTIVSKKLAVSLREKYSRVIIPFSPDYTLPYICLLHTEYFLSGSTALFAHPTIPGTGHSAMFQGKRAREFLADSGSSPTDWVAFSPIPVDSIKNSLVSDFFRVCDFTKQGVDNGAVDLQHLWKLIFTDLCGTEALLHVDNTNKFMELFQFLEDNALFSYEDINTFLVEQSSVTNRQIKDVEYSIVKNSFAANNQILDVVGSLTKQLNKTNRQITELERLVAELQTTVTQMKNLHS